MSFVSNGMDEYSKEVKAAQNKTSPNGGINTDKIVTPSKKNGAMKIVPLVDYRSDFAGVPTTANYQEGVIFFDTEEFKAAKENDESLKGLGSGISFPSFDQDPEIDPAMYILEHPEVLENARFKVSTRYESKTPLKIRPICLFPALWLNRPEGENNDDEDDKVVMMKIHQSTIVEKFVMMFGINKKFKDVPFVIQLEASGKSYSAIPTDDLDVELKKLDMEMPGLTLNPFDYINFTSRDAIVEKLAKYGVIIPPIPAEKADKLEAIEKGFAAQKAAFDKAIADGAVKK